MPRHTNSLTTRCIFHRFQNEQVAQLYQNHISSFTHRANTINGKQYNEDPTIMLWDVFNEPRCPGEKSLYSQGSSCSELRSCELIAAGWQVVKQALCSAQPVLPTSMATYWVGHHTDNADLSSHGGIVTNHGCSTCRIQVQYACTCNHQTCDTHDHVLNAPSR